MPCKTAALACTKIRFRGTVQGNAQERVGFRIGELRFALLRSGEKQYMIKTVFDSIQHIMIAKDK